MVVVPSDTRTDEGTRGGVPMTIGALPLIVPDPTITEAIIVAAESSPAGEAAVNVVVAAPEAVVVAEAGLKEPATALITVKVTVTLGIAAPRPSLTVAVTAAEPPLLIVVVVAAPNVTTTVAGVPAPLPPTGTPALLLLMAEGEQPAISPSRISTPPRTIIIPI
jgi:hypothetical protein